MAKEDLSEYSVMNTLNILEELNIDPQELSKALGRDVFNCDVGEADSSDSSSDDSDDDAGGAGAVGGIVTSRLSCTHLNLCSICLDACPGCEGAEETEPRSGELVIRIVHSEPRRQLFPLAAVEPVGNIRAGWLDGVTWDRDSGQFSDYYGESSEDENNSEVDEPPLVHGYNDSSDEGENNNEVDELPVVHGDNDEVDEELSIHSSMPSLASTSSASSEGEDVDLDEEEMTGRSLTES